MNKKNINKVTLEELVASASASGMDYNTMTVLEKIAFRNAYIMENATAPTRGKGKTVDHAKTIEYKVVDMVSNNGKPYKANAFIFDGIPNDECKEKLVYWTYKWNATIGAWVALNGNCSDKGVPEIKKAFKPAK